MGDDSTAEVAALEGVLSAIAQHAPKLRAAGVQHLRLDSFGLDLDLEPATPPEPPLPSGFKTIDDEDAEEPEDPLDDGITYGRASAPGFDALKQRKRGS